MKTFPVVRCLKLLVNVGGIEAVPGQRKTVNRLPEPFETARDCCGRCSFPWCSYIVKIQKNQSKKETGKDVVSVVRAVFISLSWSW